MVRANHVKIGRRCGDQIPSSATATPQVHATILTTMLSKFIVSPRFHSIEYPQLCSSNYSTFIGSNSSKFDCLLLHSTLNNIPATRQSLRTCFCTRVNTRTISPRDAGTQSPCGTLNDIGKFVKTVSVDQSTMVSWIDSCHDCFS